MILDANHLPEGALKKAYDYIVIGSGSGGAPVVRRLVDAGAEVLLIEAGPSGFDVAEINDPTQWVPLGRSTYDWGYNYAPTDLIDGRTIPMPRGKVLGGSSSINAMMWYRGHPMDYDAWENAGAKGWSFADCLPYFKRCEDWEEGETALRGSGGPLKIARSPSLHPTAQALIDGAGELGIPIIDDPNGPDNEGATQSNFNILNGQRFSSAHGYLLPVLEAPNLTILTNSLATKLIIEKGICTGVRHRVGPMTVETAAANEVVMALGAVDTPRLLMQSGLGPEDELKRLGVAIVAHLPGVGQNLQDHPLVRAINFRARQPLGQARDNGGGSMVNWKISAALTQANLHAFPIQSRSGTAEVVGSHDLTVDVFAIGTGLMRSRSIGFLRLTSAEPLAPLEIQPNFLSEPADLDDLVVAVSTILELPGTKAYKDWFSSYAAPKSKLNRAETIAFIRQACSTFFHICGTAKMGTDPLSVVDPTLKVHGISGLRISDASVIPIIPTCNTHAPATMIGERAADFILTGQ